MTVSQAGIRTGDQVIAVDGRVFPSVAAFAAYVGSMPPGREISIDYMPANGGPQDAQRVGVRMGGGTRDLASQSAPGHGGLTFGQKAAIGAGAAALFGCYELGCFSRKPATNAPQ